MMFSGDETGYGSFNPPPFIQPGVTPPTETKPEPQVTTGSAGMTPEQIAELQKRFEGYKPEEIKRVADVGPEEMKDILARRQSALAGFQAPELAAMQAQMALGQQAGQQQRERALQAALAKQGIRGGSAASLQAQAAQQAFREKGQMDTEMMLRQAQRQREALGEYEGGVKGSLDFAQKQQFADLARNLSMEQIIAAQQAAALQAEATKSYGESMAEASKEKGKVICTELYEQGLMTKEVFEADQRFGSLQDAETMAGYHIWAKPIVKLMKQSKLITWVVHKIATPWAKQMAFEMGVIDRPSLIGTVMMTVGLPVCRFIGGLIVKKEKAHGY
jgi:hypothetical protein